MAYRRTIGVIGGMGPAATADFLAKLVALAGAAADADHPRVLVDSNAQVPDRNAAMAGGPSPGPVLADMAARLVAQGATVLAMPCNAAHGWADAVRAVPGAQFISIMEAAIAQAMAVRPRCIGIIAIGPTLAFDLYGRASPVPVLAADVALVQPAITRIKAGDRGRHVRAVLASEARRLADAGAGAIIAACTEAPLVLRAGDVPVPLVDATAALAQATLHAAR
ncbi:MAG: amino acid racemase [Sphingomonadales bacterium]|jgi:aspartate racemase